jgi:hypothetical protein
MDKRFQNLVLLTLAAVSDIPTGIPSGHIYAVTMGQGVTLCEHTQIIGTLVRAGWATERGHLVTATAKGREIGDKINAALADKSL